MRDLSQDEPAFPGAVDTAAPLGMSLRDYFAAKAMEGLIANPGNTGHAKELARIAYGIADEMMEFRKK